MKNVVVDINIFTGFLFKREGHEDGWYFFSSLGTLDTTNYTIHVLNGELR